jgi:hypothetical protein
MAESGSLPSATLFNGLCDAVETALGCRLKVRHPRVDPAALAALPGIVHDALAERWRACDAGTHVGRSKQNWRWREPVTTFAVANTSDEVGLERAIATAAQETAAPWANQVPVASGLPGHNRRRAIDLVRRDADGAFTFVELKIGSDGPLYAAYELLAYASAWLLTRRERLAPDRPMLRANAIALVVLAPQRWYRATDMAAWGEAVDAGARTLGEGQGVRLSFRYDVLDPALDSAGGTTSLPTGAALIAALDASLA